LELLTREVETVQVEDSLQKPEEHNGNGDPAERLSDLLSRSGFKAEVR